MFSQKKSVFIFSPHPDDETLGCGGTIIKRLMEGYNVNIIVMTDGSHSHSTVLNIWSNPTPEELASIRKKEAIAASNVLGVSEKNITFLDVEDGFLLNAINQTVEKVKDLLSLESNISEIFVTHSKDHHKDHKATNLIVRRAIKELMLRKIALFNYLIWGRNEEFDLGVRYEVDISDVLAVKAKAIMTYESQIDILFPQQKKPILRKKFVDLFTETPVETFWK